MTATHPTPAEDPAGLGRAVETPSEPFVISERTPKNAAVLFSLLTGYVTHMTDEQAQAALPDCFQNVEIVLQSSEVRRNEPDADADTDHADTTELRGGTS